ncbi:hydrogenase nickel incorporation protein HypB [Clostridium pasteurianum DSM 525 = ATCC 6013]|uniref:Hydrogenase accessory protein HypB n=1 Tax=Clostridium pasteurianum DSM 525 = ATCC 6013 TaxID=1262449 RepID=A0A0H3J752_CLOPA|nr:hydrogenase nickel incorporation protein HypB [Clostridium pasteurianum]AJA46810.1 hydrogenase nickel incorporation protein HypB [Clostridium pasteurianum DSM 525 = ATCC 6013]AJA50798.1 hydrogenase nickel incorporation protein HypB [Clostridium pasteurianum DSM 525 = ATCC 6013]AOZ74204.1 hydantoin utilization protein A [Clostridium pasteurianum DSM 525 = ATCC 6013]AOZ78002.1 hydantoin utilization protein A [Clostridium pasteurianum]ELP58579.1 Ni2+ insertion GTPase [Clostridium pasteurianum 
MSEIKVVTNILQTNDEITSENKKILDEKGIYVVNLMSSPGSGKTSILEKVISKFKDGIKIAVIEGDIYTTKDAERIEAQGVPVVQINTGGACHLDGDMIKNSLNSLNLDEINLLVIENVGNLVCPAEFEIGEDIKICVLSTAEGNDKPLKYPLMFEKSSAVILNKIDLMPFTNFDREEFYRDVESLNANAVTFETSCVKDEGLEELCVWLKEKIVEKNQKH